MQKQEHHPEEFFMQRALALARLGQGYVSPNPLVGCVIVHDGRIIGEGWHKKYGEAHAEVNALLDVKDKMLLRKSTVYVNLEPCSHFGKTPPCADMLIREQVSKVVVANLDTNPLVAGEGVKKLRAAGTEVITDILNKEGRELNKRFFTWMEKQRPYIILKWAQTSDGLVAREDLSSKWISNELSRSVVHKWRCEEDAVLVGTRTAQCDNPRLNVRDWTGRDPVRIVIDKFLKLDDKLNLFDGTQRTICYNVLKDENRPNLVLVRLREENFLQDLISDLYRQKIQSVIIEGGAETIRYFIDTKHWDEARVFVSSKTFEKGVRAPVLQGSLMESHTILTDTLKIYHPY